MKARQTTIDLLLADLIRSGRPYRLLRDGGGNRRRKRLRLLPLLGRPLGLLQNHLLTPKAAMLPTQTALDRFVANHRRPTVRPVRGLIAVDWINDVGEKKTTLFTPSGLNADFPACFDTSAVERIVTTHLDKGNRVFHVERHPDHFLVTVMSPTEWLGKLTVTPNWLRMADHGRTGWCRIPDPVHAAKLKVNTTDTLPYTTSLQWGMKRSLTQVTVDDNLYYAGDLELALAHKVYRIDEWTETQIWNAFEGIIACDGLKRCSMTRNDRGIHTGVNLTYSDPKAETYREFRVTPSWLRLAAFGGQGRCRVPVTACSVCAGEEFGYTLTKFGIILTTGVGVVWNDERAQGQQADMELEPITDARKAGPDTCRV